MEEEALVKGDKDHTFGGVEDAAVEHGMGTVKGLASENGVKASEDHLIALNHLGDMFIGSVHTPPKEMFTDGKDGGFGSYDAASVDTVNGALIYPTDLYGREFETPDWTVELFFKAHGDLTETGPNCLIRNQVKALVYALKLNASKPGSLDLLVSDGNQTPHVLTIDTLKVADGKWTYVVAEYDSKARKVRLRARTEDGKAATADALLENPVAAGTGSNLLIGRNAYRVAESPETFLGLIDEVRISGTILSDDKLLGRIK